MTSATVTLLQNQLNPLVLTLHGRAARYAVVDWYLPVYMQKDHLQNGKADVLFSVKNTASTASRNLSTYRVPHTDRTQLEIVVWLIDSPSYTRGEKDTLRDAAVAEVQRILKANPAYGTEKSTRNDDHARGNLWVICTVVTVSKITETQ